MYIFLLLNLELIPFVSCPHHIPSPLCIFFMTFPRMTIMIPHVAPVPVSIYHDLLLLRSLNDLHFYRTGSMHACSTVAPTFGTIA